MKKTVLIMLCSFMMVTACSHGISEKSLKAGKWHIISCKVDGKPMDEKFRGCKFLFLIDNRIQAFYNNKTCYGSWKSAPDYLTDDEPSGNGYISFAFTKNTGLSALNGEYEVVSQSAKMLEMEARNSVEHNVATLVLKRIK